MRHVIFHSCYKVYHLYFITHLSFLKYISGKVLIIGGGIANFTNVAATFKVSFLDTRVNN